jgi:hypothetical protein
MEYDDNPGVRYLYEKFSKDTYKPDSNWCLPSEFKLDPVLYKNQFKDIVIPNIDPTKE